jgi:hypothetical protein
MSGSGLDKARMRTEAEARAAGHTPTPWCATKAEYGEETLNGHQRDGDWTLSTDPETPGWNHDGGYPGYGLSAANAAFVALAVNSYDAMRTALEGMLTAYEAVYLGEGGGRTAMESQPEFIAAGAALALARGEKPCT